MQDRYAAPLPCAGFETGCEAEGRRHVQCVRIPAADGRYHLRVTLKAQRDAPEALLYGDHRRLLWRGSLAAGEEKSVSALTVVHPYMQETECTASRGIELALAADGVKIDDVQARPVHVPALLMMGDSTMTDQGAQSPFAPGATYAGWGQMMPIFAGENACVINFAKSGRTVETFRTEGHYDLLKSQAKPGDFALMQFGHNDQKRAHLRAAGGYTQAIVRYIEELRALGVTPVLVTPLARNSWFDAHEYNDLLLEYADTCRRIAEEQGVPLVDLHAFMRDTILARGREPVKTLFHIGDYTHTNDFGAHLAAGYVSAQLRVQGILPMREDGEWTPHGPYDVPADDQGDESLTPTGLEALYRRYETERPDAPLSRIEAIELVCRTCALFAANGDTALPEDVAPDAPYADDVRCAVQSRLLAPEMMRRLAPDEPIAAKAFGAMLARGYTMRCPEELPPPPDGETIARAQAAALCRLAVI